MPDRVKEKLVELLNAIDGVCPKDSSCYDCEYKKDVKHCAIPAKADYLIANGVTVQGDKDINVPSKWISVKDRLPEEHDSIFSYLYGTKSWQPGMHRKVTDEVIACAKRKDGRKRVVAIKMWDGEWDWHKLQDDEKVTHWMPLPQPPKGE